MLRFIAFLRYITHVVLGHVPWRRSALICVMCLASVMLVAELSPFSFASLPDPAMNTASNKDDNDGVSPSIENTALIEEKDSPELLMNKVLYDHSIPLVTQQSDTFTDLLAKSGIDRPVIFEVSESLKKQINLNSLKVGQPITVYFREIGTQDSPEASMELVAIVIELPEKQVMVWRNINNGQNPKDVPFAAETITKNLQKRAIRTAGVVNTSLYGLAGELGIPSAVMAQVFRAFSFDVDFQRDIQKGTRLEVMYEAMFDEKGTKIRNGSLIYSSLTLGNKELRLYRYQDSSGQEDYYNEKGQSVRKGLLKTPIASARITSGFGMRRHPALGFSRMHKGVDFGAPIGTAVYAAGDGTVEIAGKKGQYGNYVRLRHNNTYATAYAHLQRFAKGISIGSRVKQGQIIAYVGNTGLSTGPHLHFEVLIDSKQVNPMGVKMATGRKISDKEMSRFKQFMNETQALLKRLPLQSQVAKN